MQTMGKHFGTGRLVLWRGGSIWIGHTDEKTEIHSHHLIQLTLALSDGPVCFQTPGRDWQRYAAAIVGSHQPHAFEAQGQLVALVFVEPESREGRVLRERYPDSVHALAPDLFTAEAQALAAGFLDGASDEELAAQARSSIARLTSLQDRPVRPLDKRVESAIDELRHRLGESVTLGEIADHVHLSAERFRHLFLEATGIRFRPYILWLRIETALASITAGKSITEAAQDGGFADSAHFARTFKRLCGVSAISVHMAPAPP
jgi:AraC-like DNA-binding protein